MYSWASTYTPYAVDVITSHKMDGGRKSRYYAAILSGKNEVTILCNVSPTQAQIKSYMMMLLKGVAYLHGNSIMHRVSIV